jgi:DNA modification methylase
VGVAGDYMTPYYSDSLVTIYHGDCRESAWQLSAGVDLLCGDPPYGIRADERQANRAGKRHGAAAVASKDYGVSAWDKTPPPAWLLAMLIERSRHAILWGGNHLSLSASSCWLVWDKDNGDNGYADCELAWTNLESAVRRIRYRWMGMLQERMGSDKEYRFHPTQKPVDVIQWAIMQAPDDCRLILDPWMGSGTTLVAAKNLGRKAIGIEAEERYCEIAAERCRQETLFGEVA